jgi:hypothetical protein
MSPATRCSCGLAGSCSPVPPCDDAADLGVTARPPGRLPALQVAFQKCDLYSKTEERLDVAQLKPYYMGLISK